MNQALTDCFIDELRAAGLDEEEIEEALHHYSALLDSLSREPSVAPLQAPTRQELDDGGPI
jgi:hypothetical protein